MTLFFELELLGDPIQDHAKAQLFCDSLQEMIMLMVQLAPAMASNFTKATGDLNSMRDILISDKAMAGVDCYIAELGIEPQ
jgi:hypothetical protein